MEERARSQRKKKKIGALYKTTDTKLSQERAIDRRYEERSALCTHKNNICFKVRLTHIHTNTGLPYDKYTHAWHLHVRLRPEQEKIPLHRKIKPILTTFLIYRLLTSCQNVSQSKTPNGPDKGAN